MPLVAEIGGRWHPSVPLLVRRLAKEATSRVGSGGQTYAAALASRWAARLSAHLLRGNAAVQRALHREPSVALEERGACATSLPHLLPEGECNYELLCGHLRSSDDEWAEELA